VGLVTGLRNNFFFSSRAKLVLIYLSSLLLILGFSSFVLYLTLSKNIQENFHGDASSEQSQALIINKTNDQLQSIIIFTDLLFLIFSLGISFYLADQTLKPLQESLQEQKRFTADVSHDLRTPLASLQTNLEVALREKSFSEIEIRQILSRSLEEVQFMTKMSENLLFLARIENNKKIIKFVPVDLSSMLEKLIQTFLVQADFKKIQITTEFTPSVFVQGDPENLQRLFNNILSNALNYTPVNGKINLLSKKINKEILISIKDSGPGIPAQFIPHIFERFYQIDQARQHPGNGLGLAIAKSIVDQHFGQIKIESKVGVGTEVLIHLPFIRSSPALG
jgi:signal transduction histidine kinase